MLPLNKHNERFPSFWELSTVASINASVVQGFGIGASAFNMNASDRQPEHTQNNVVKYAYDTYLIVGASMRGTVREELE